MPSNALRGLANRAVCKVGSRLPAGAGRAVSGLLVGGTTGDELGVAG